MIGIVIISHSAKLAEGVRELAEQMVQGKVPITTAGGLDVAEDTMGTDPMKIVQAIEAIDHSDDIVVLMDLGSAVLSAEMAVEFLPPDQQAKVHLCPAPLVEGTVAAAVQAAIGGSLDQVLKEAQSALTAKRDLLGAPPVANEDTLQLMLVVQNKLGLHARPAVNFVKTASQFQADIWVSKGNKSANAKSFNQVATLGVRQGEEIILTATGAEASQALDALKILADNNFGKADDTENAADQIISPITDQLSVDQALIGIPASPGIAIGPAFHYKLQLPEVQVKYGVEPEAEWSKLIAGIAQAQTEIKHLQIQATKQVGAAKAAIFEAHQLFLEDPTLLDSARKQIFDAKLNAEVAWQQAVDEVVQDLQALDDEYLRGRAVDMADVGQRVLRQMLAVELPSLQFDQPVILMAQDLTPSDTVRLDTNDILGICIEQGGVTSHSTILARALGIPAIVGLNGSFDTVAEGQLIGLNGVTGQLWLTPTNEQVTELRQQRETWQQAQTKVKSQAKQLVTTQDGRRISVAANISGTAQAQTALDFGAEGVGLFRTEFLFMNRTSAPGEEEQYQTYKQVAELMGEHPFIIRTLDVGGDKPLPYLDLETEANPFLGWRGIRYCLDHPEIFKPQLRAILRASAGAGHNVKVMFPMISTLTELQAAKVMLAEAQQELDIANQPYDSTMEVGLMIEVPSAVINADKLAQVADFFSIGTNDLTQYVMAADRGNSNVATLANALHPAVLRMIDQTVQAAHSAGIWVGLCGELAGNPLATPVLLGLGLGELSMSAPNIPQVKSTIQQWDLVQAQAVAQAALKLDSAETVQDYLRSIEK